MSTHKTFSEKQKSLIEIFEILAKHSPKYQVYLLYLQHFPLTGEKEDELESILNEALMQVKDFNLGFEGNIAMLHYRLQKLKSKKMEDIDMLTEIDAIQAILNRLEEGRKNNK